LPEKLLEAKRLMAAGSFMQAEHLLRAYVAEEPRSGEAHYMLAYSLLRQNQPKESLQEYTAAAALQKPGAAELREVAQAYVLLVDYADANRWLMRSLQMDSADAETWYSVGRLRYTEQRFADAVDAFTRALTLAPKSVKVENNLGLAYEGLNRTDDAAAAYRQAVAWQNPNSIERGSEQPMLNLAIVLIHRGDLDEALRLLQRALTIVPNDPRILEQLGQLYMQRANYTDAQRILSEAARLDPKKSNLHFLLGQAYRHLGRPQEAKAEFDLAAKLTRDAATPKSN
jgi:Flp pilus assembly protein TadD